MHSKGVILVGILLSSQPAWAASSDLAQSAPIREEMAGLYHVTSELLPVVINKADFESKARSKEIAGYMNRLKELTNTMSKKSGRFADSDPSIRFVSERFSEDVQYAIEMWNKGDREIPRRLLRNVTDYCISCHTRTNKGTHFHDHIQSKGFKSLPPLMKAEYLTATRHYESALKQYEHVVVNQPLFKSDPLAWEHAVQKMLAITTRVKEDASLTVEMISRLQDKSESVPPHMRLKLAEWRQAAKSWVEQQKSKKTTDDERILEVKDLLSQGAKVDSKVEGGALIHHLRASSILHEILGRTKSGPKYQELLWMAGVSAQSLNDLNLWTMQDVYFESCIRAGGQKDLSRKCLKGFEDSMLKSYGARSRSGLPEFARTRLGQLEGSIR